MTDHDRATRALPPAFAAAPSPQQIHPRAGRFRRAASYVLASVCSQPLLALGAPALCIAVGLSHLWATPPTWVVTAEYRLAAHATDPVPASLRVEVTPAELRDLLVSAPIVREVESSVRSLAGEDPGTGAPGALRQAAIDGWSALRAVPQRLAAALGTTESSPARPAEVLTVRPEGRASEAQVVRISVRAASPRFAEAAPQLLLDAVRDMLRREDRSRTMARLEELNPAREEAAERLRLASDAVTQYRLEIGRHDPDVSANDLQARLIDTRAKRAELETDLEEAEANRVDIARQLAGAAVEQTTRVVVEQNRRIQELKNEISTLEARYAADLAVKTPKHEDMVRLRLEIESKKRDLNNEEILVIREKVQEPSLEYVGLLERQAQNNRQLVTLAGRELGLAETESRLLAELTEAMQTAQRMEELVSEREAAAASLGRFDAEAALLESRLSSVIPFSHLTLVGPPRVADPNTPDAPNAARHVAWTLAVAVLAMFLLPTLRALMRSRLVAPWQIESLGRSLPVELAGELPGPVQRALLHLPGGRRS